MIACYRQGVWVVQETSYSVVRERPFKYRGGHAPFPGVAVRLGSGQGSRGPSGRRAVGTVDPGHQPSASALGWVLATLRAAQGGIASQPRRDATLGPGGELAPRGRQGCRRSQGRYAGRSILPLAGGSSRTPRTARDNKDHEGCPSLRSLSSLVSLFPQRKPGAGFGHAVLARSLRAPGGGR